MPAQLLGAHMPAPGGIHNAIRSGSAIGCRAVQVFTSSPQMWRASAVTEEKVALFRQSMEETGIESVVSHDSYLVNLCAPSDEIRKKSREALAGEMFRCAVYGIPFVVSHMGSAMGQDTESALALVAEAAREILEETPQEVTLLMETTAGQGSALNSRFEELAWLLEALQGHSRLCVCLDTCHIFAAGYDIRTEEAYEATFQAFEKIVGFDRLRAIHANDSKKGLGTRVDRHAHIGQGELGREAFRLLVNDPRMERVPILLETPEAETMHEVNLRTLEELREPSSSRSQA
jgi:deoxyribonuclease IV